MYFERTVKTFRRKGRDESKTGHSPLATKASFRLRIEGFEIRTLKQAMHVRVQLSNYRMYIYIYICIRMYLYMCRVRTIYIYI